MKAYTQILASVLILLMLLSLGFMSGCKKKDELKEEQPITIDNLQTAYGAEVKRATWYDLFAKQAASERLTNLATLFHAVGRSEQIHAEKLASLLKSKGYEPRSPIIDTIAAGKAIQYLRGAVSLESQEVESMYPNIIAVAELEKFADVAAEFRLLQKGDSRHFEIFKEIFEREGKIPKADYSVCKVCGNLMTSASTAECPVCKAKRDKFESIQ